MNKEEIKEIKDLITFNFSDTVSAYKFLSKKGENYIDFMSFKDGINSLLSHRFKEINLLKIWNEIFGVDKCNYENYVKVFGENKR